MLELILLHLVVSKHLLYLSGVSLVNFTHVLLELGVLFVLLHLEVQVTLLVCLHLFLLISVPFLKLKHVFFHHLGQSLLVFALSLLLKVFE